MARDLRIECSWCGEEILPEESDEVKYEADRIIHEDCLEESKKADHESRKPDDAETEEKLEEILDEAD